MSETNHHDGGGAGRSHPGGGYPSQGPGPYGHDSAPPAPPVSASSAPSGPWTGSAPSASSAPWAGSAPSAATAPAATSGAPGAPSLSAAQAGAALRRFGIGNPLPTFVIGALAYVVALCAALVVIVSAVASVLALDTGDLTGGGTVPTDSSSSSGGGGWRAIVGIVGLPFQLVSLGSFGSYDIELSLGFLGDAQMSWRGLPLLITVAMVASAFLGARIVQRRWSSNGVLGALLWSGVSGLAVALFAVILTRLTAFAVEDDSLGMSLSMHSAGIDMFFGTWLLIGLPLFLGHVAGLEKPAWWPVVADLVAAPRLALVHALVFALPVGALIVAGGAISMVVDGQGRDALSLLLALPIWGLSGLALLPGLGMLVVPMHVNLRGDVEELGVDRTDQFLWFFDLPWYAWIPMVLIALLMPLVVALLWNRDREIEKGNILAQVVSWAALPLAYFAGSLVLLALVLISTQVQMGMLGDAGATVGLAVWMPLVAFFIGLVVEVLARFGAPFVDRFVPGMLVNWFRRSARRRRLEGAPAVR